MDLEETPLEVSLARAAIEPAHRPEFYRLLLTSEILVLGKTEVGEGRRTLEAGEKLAIVNWQKRDGTPIVPFFASLSALRKAIKEETSYVSLPARSFFEITRGATLVLNPASNHAKEFFPAEVDALLTTGMNQAAQTRILQKSTKVLLGQPANYPSAMVSSLTTLLSKHPAVIAAYLCLMHDPETQEKPTLVVGFEGDADVGKAMQEAGVVAADTAPKGEPVDFVRVTRGQAGISDYMIKSVKPFYKRSWGAKLKSLLGHGRA